MTKYEIVKLPGASPDLVTAALNKRAKEGFILEFVDNGWFVLAKWEEDEATKNIPMPIPMTRENENETEDVE